MNTEKLEQALRDLQFVTTVWNFRNAQAQLEIAKDRAYPRPCPVQVTSERYRGHGIAVNCDGVPADKLNVLLENGNTWHYPIEHCRRVEWSAVDRATRRAWLRRQGYKLTAQCGPRHPLP